MLSIEKCKQILNSEKRKYSEEEVIIIKDTLYQLAKADVNLFKYIRNGKSEKSNTLLPGINNRTS